MIWAVYNFLFVVGFVCLAPHYLWRMRRRGGYRQDFGQRFGFYRPDISAQLAKGGRVWVHCVSVGEAFVALALADALRALKSDVRFVFSTATSTGYALLKDRTDPADVVIYWPIDFPPVMGKVLRLMRPAALILIEAELWPNVIRMLHVRRVPIFLCNGRISERSYRGYQRVRVFTRRILPMFEALCVQTRADEERLSALGAPAERLHLMNSAKYRLEPPNSEREAEAKALLAEAGLDADRPLVLGGSTWPGEESALLDVYDGLRGEFPEMRLVLAPRHVERCPEIAEEIERRGLRLALRSRLLRDPAPSEATARPAPPDVFLLDTTGELKYFYPAVQLVFMGKSLCAEGGQNIIEPAQYGRPIVVGPHMQNFPVILEDFLLAGAIRVVRNSNELRDEVRRLLHNPECLTELGANAGRLIREKAGAVEQTAALIRSRLEAA
jgi:3-deoxy-D-manno-octulosonic-acid transferase